ncbi:MAG: leucine-rich repeat protein [Candidatus Methanomethylophilaceae archaeon]|nr:leucine-rich repeat protein [Candidatus Methanomethylophilaceae archaeon]
MNDDSGCFRLHGTLCAAIFVVVLAAVVLFAIPQDDADASASGSYEGIQWELTDDGELTISGSGTIPTRKEYSSIYSSASGARSLKIVGSIAGIASYAFPSMDGLDYAEFTSTITSINSRSGLSSITFMDADGSTALSATVQGLAGHSFVGNASVLIRVAEVGDALSDGDWSFEVTSLSPNKASLIGYSGAGSSISVPSSATTPTGLSMSVVSLGDGLLSGRTDIFSVEIPSSVTSIGAGAFSGCASIEHIAFPSSIADVGAGAFQGLTFLDHDGATLDPVPSSLAGRCFEGTGAVLVRDYPVVGDVFSSNGYTFRVTSDIPMQGALIQGRSGGVSVPVSVMYKSAGVSITAIGDGAFEGLALREVYIPANVISIGAEAFKDVTMSSLTIRGASVEIGEMAFSGTDLASVSVPASPAVHPAVFKDCASLVSASVIGGEIGQSMFQGCISLSSVTTSVPVASVGAYGFSGCSSLCALDLSSAAFIGDHAFAGSGLEGLDLSGASITAIGAGTFSGCPLAYASFPDALATVEPGAFEGVQFRSCDGSEAMEATAESLAGRTFVGSGGVLLATPYVGAEFESGALTYKVTSVEPLEASVTGSQPSESISIPGAVQAGTFVLAVTSIGDSAFKSRSVLRTISVPDSVTSIGDSAFRYCSGLEAIDLPDQLDSIGDCAFQGCSSLTAVRIPDSVTSLGEVVFGMCDSLVSVTFPSSMTTIPYSTFSYSMFTSFAVQDGITTIGKSAFAGCSRLESVTLPESVTVLDDFAFFLCSSLRSIDLCYVSKIGSETFARCTGLQSILIPDDLQTRHDSFFGISFLDMDGSTVVQPKGCKLAGSGGVLSIVAPAVGDRFRCEGLLYETTSTDPMMASLIGSRTGSDELSVPASVTCSGVSLEVHSVGPRAFYGAGLVSVDLGCVSEIGNRAFAYCGMTELTVPGNVGGYAFYKCAALETLVLSEGASVLSASAFSGCTSLASISFPGTLSSVGANAFHPFKFYSGGTALATDAGSLAEHLFTGSGKTMSLFIPSVGDTFSSGGLVYKVTSNGADKEASVYGPDGEQTAVSIPESVRYMGFDWRVMGVCDKAFYDCASLASVDLGSVGSIGTKAFAYCTGLTSVTVPCDVGQYAFYKCSSLKTIRLSEGVEEVAKSAFSGCTGVRTMYFPDSLSSVGANAFHPCSFYVCGYSIAADADSLAGHKFVGTKSAMEAYIPVKGGSFVSGDMKFKVLSNGADKTVTLREYMGSSACVTVPEAVRYLGFDWRVVAVYEKVFYQNTTLESIDLGAVASIGERAFNGCTGLSVVAMGSVESIASCAFSGCTGLTSMSFSDGLSSLGSNAFYKIKFFDGGSSVPRTAANLAGKIFEGSGSVLYLVAQA